MLFHEAREIPQFGGTKSVVGGDRHRFEPELGFRIVARHMNVRRLIAFAAVEVEAIRADAQHGGHTGRLPGARAVSNLEVGIECWKHPSPHGNVCREPRKIRQLVADLERAGVALASGGNGSHRKFRYPNFPGALILRGQSSDDAQHYQERDIRSAIYKISQ